MAVPLPGDATASNEAESLTTPSHMTKTALAISALRTAILRGDLPPDASLTVGRIAQMLGMSPTPVREAIRTLQAEGLLQHQPHHTVSVNSYTTKDIRDLYQMRADLESQATRIAAPRLSDADLDRLAALNEQMRRLAASDSIDALNRLNADWHLLIYSAADNRILLDLVQHLWKRFVWDVNWILPGRALRSIEEHDAVLGALRSRDADEAVKRMRAHLQYGEEFAVEYLEKRSSGKSSNS